MKTRNKFISHRTLFVLLCTAVSLAACTGALGSGTAGEPAYHVTSNRPSSQVTVSNETDTAIVEVYSDNGIGNAMVKLVNGEWPESILMRFHLQGLEGLQFSYGETVTGLSFTTQNRILQGVTVADGPIEAIDEESDYWMPIAFVDRNGTAVDAPTSGGVIEVQAPADFLHGDYAEFTINWIDFYR